LLPKKRSQSVKTDLFGVLGRKEHVPYVIHPANEGASLTHPPPSEAFGAPRDEGRRHEGSHQEGDQPWLDGRKHSNHHAHGEEMPYGVRQILHGHPQGAHQPSSNGLDVVIIRRVLKGTQIGLRQNSFHHEHARASLQPYSKLISHRLHRGSQQLDKRNSADVDSEEEPNLSLVSGSSQRQAINQRLVKP